MAFEKELVERYTTGKIGLEQFSHEVGIFQAGYATQTYFAAVLRKQEIIEEKLNELLAKI